MCAYKTGPLAITQFTSFIFLGLWFATDRFRMLLTCRRNGIVAGLTFVQLSISLGCVCGVAGTFRWSPLTTSLFPFNSNRSVKSNKANSVNQQIMESKIIIPQAMLNLYIVLTDQLTTSAGIYYISIPRKWKCKPMPYTYETRTKKTQKRFLQQKWKLDIF